MSRIKIFYLSVLVVLLTVWRQATVWNVVFFVPVLLIRVPVMGIALIIDKLSRLIEAVDDAGLLPYLKWNYAD